MMQKSNHKEFQEDKQKIQLTQVVLEEEIKTQLTIFYQMKLMKEY